MQKRVWVVQKTLGRPLLPGPKRVKKDLLHPPLTTFGEFPFLGNFPSPQHPNTTKKLCDKDFAERSGELSDAICLKTLVLLGNDR